VRHQAVRFLMDSDCGLFRRGVDQAEGLAVRAVEPVGEEADPVAILNLEVALVRTFDVFLGDIA